MLFYITLPLKLNNNGLINVNIKRCRYLCSLLVWNGFSIVFRPGNGSPSTTNIVLLLVVVLVVIRFWMC